MEDVVSTDVNGPVDLKAQLGRAEPIVAGLAWRMGRTVRQRRLVRGRVAALSHQVAALMAAGWSVEEVRAGLADAPGAVAAPDPAAQERLWRAALNRAKHARRRVAQPPAGHDGS
jgi:hypothetical protein